MWRRVGRWLRRLVLGALAAVAVVVAVALIVVHTDWGRARLRDRVVAGLRAQFPGGVTIGRLDGSVLGDLVLRDVVVRDASGGPVVSAKQVRLNLGYAALLGGELALETLIIDGVTVDLRLQPAAALATMYRPSPEPSTWDVALRHVEVHHAQVTIDRGGGQVEHLDDLELAAVVHVVAGGPLDASIEVGGRWRERGAAPLAITAVARVDGGRVTVPSAGATVGRASVVATAVDYRGPTDVRGALVITSPDGELARLAPGLGLAGLPIAVTAAVAPAAGAGLAIRIGGGIVGATVGGAVVVRPTGPRPRVDGTVTVTALDLARLGPGLPPSQLAATIGFGVERDPAVAGLAGVRGAVEVTGQGVVAAVALDQVRVAVALADGAAAIDLRGRGPGGTVVAGTGRLVVGDRVVLRDGHLVATIAALGPATRGASPVDGAVELTVDGEAQLLGGAPPTVDVRASVRGRGLRRADVRIGAVELTASARGPLAGLVGQVHLVARRSSRAGAALPDVTVTARGGLTEPIAVQLDARDRRRGVSAAIAARVVIGGDGPGQLAQITLGRYRLTGRQSEIAGQGGQITVAPDRLVVRGLRARGAGGSLAIDGRAGLGRRAGQLDGSLALTGLDLARVRGLPGVPVHAAGVVDVTVDLVRRGATVTGSARVVGRALVVTAAARPVDLAVTAEVGPHRVAGTVTVDGAELGALAAAIDVIPPRRLADLSAWTRLDRQALRAVHLDARGLDLARLAALVGRGPAIAGRVDAALDLDPTTARATVRGRRLVTDRLPAPVDLDLELDLAALGTATVAARATLHQVGAATVTAGVAVPARLFDLAAWRATDLQSVQGLAVTVDELVVDDAMARRLGLGTVRGTVAATVTAEPGLGALAGHLVVRDLIAGPLVAPVTVTVEAAVDARGTRATVEVGLARATVAVVEVATPTTVATVVAGRVDLATIAVTGSVRIPDTELTPIVRALGQAPRLAGRVRGDATVAGTLGAPTATVALVITELAARIPRGGGAARGGLRELTVDASYQGGAIRGEVRGRQDDGGTLHVTAAVDPTRLVDARASITATNFQLGPLTRLAPAFLLGVRGELDADLQLRGADPRTARLLGIASVSGLQVPLSDTIGNLRDATVEVRFQAGAARLAVAGAVESGRVSAVATTTLDGLIPRAGELDVTVKSLALITSLAPRFDGQVHVEVAPAGDRWRATARLTGATVTIPNAAGRQLHPAGLPLDLVFTRDTRVGVPVPPTRVTALRAWLGVRPTRPLVALALDLDPVTVMSPKFRGEVTGHLDLAIGEDGASVDGRIAVARGNVVLFERRYGLRDAALVFDGGIDPLLEIQLEYEFPQLAMQVVLGGRLSKPILTLASNPSTYTEGQLLGFLLGGAPGLPGRETVDAATGVAAAVASQLVGGFVSRRLPIHLDVLNYEPASEASSGAFVFGRWLTSKLLVLVRTRVEARADENVNEGEVEYWLNQRVLVEGSGGDRGILGLDLLWNRRW